MRIERFILPMTLLTRVTVAEKSQAQQIISMTRVLNSLYVPKQVEVPGDERRVTKRIADVDILVEGDQRQVQNGGQITETKEEATVLVNLYGPQGLEGDF